MDEDKCIFCKLSRGGTGIFEMYGEMPFVAVFDRYPVAPGHLLIIPRRHVAKLADLDPSEWRLLKVFMQWCEVLVLSVDLRQIYFGYTNNPLDERSLEFCRAALEHPRINTDPDGYNWGVNEGEAAGQTVPHLHIHLIPRYLGDMDDPTGGVRHVIPEKGNYKK